MASPIETSVHHTSAPDLAGRAPLIRNALTINVEEWFQASLFQNRIPRHTWTQLTSRVERDNDTILQLLADHQATATFFMLGWVAERHPELVRRIAAAGHEIACRGYDRTALAQMTPATFAEDLICAKAILEDICGQEVDGYRIPDGTLSTTTPWVYSVLADCGFHYSASTFPHRRAGGRRAERPAPFPNRASHGVVEIPNASLPFLGRRWPGPSGLMLRLFPYSATHWMVQRLNATEHVNVVFACESWEFDASTPPVVSTRLTSRLGHYVGRGQMARRFSQMLFDSRWERLDDVFHTTLLTEPTQTNTRPAGAPPSISGVLSLT